MRHDAAHGGRRRHLRGAQFHQRRLFYPYGDSPGTRIDRSRDAKRGGRTIKYCEPVGNHARMTEAPLAPRHGPDRAWCLPPQIPAFSSSAPWHGFERQFRRRSEAARRSSASRRAGSNAEVITPTPYMEEEPLISEMGMNTLRNRMPSWCRSSSPTACTAMRTSPCCWGSPRNRRVRRAPARQAHLCGQPLFPARQDALLRQRHRDGADVRRRHPGTSGGIRRGGVPRWRVPDERTSTDPFRRGSTRVVARSGEIQIRPSGAGA